MGELRSTRASSIRLEKQCTKDFAHEQNTKASEDAMTGASACGLLGG